MTHKQIIDPDAEVIGMVNDGVTARERVAENRALLHQMAKEQDQLRKANLWREIRSMAIEAGAFAIGGVATLIAMGHDLVSPIVGIPVFLVCLIWAAVRVDRFIRR